MNLVSAIYHASIPEKGASGIAHRLKVRIAGLLRRSILMVSDPICNFRIHGADLAIPLSHPLPIYQTAHPQCDTVLGRMAGWMRERGIPINYIDVGANIGDTIAAISPEACDRVVAIEPHPPYACLLEANVKQFPCSVEIVRKGCSDIANQESMAIVGNSGTGVLTHVADGGVPITTIDSLMSEMPSVGDCNLLKVDVDGYDFAVIRGARRLLSERRPYVLFEVDIFRNDNFLEDLTAINEIMRESGYNDLLIYDNYGGFVCAVKIKDIESIFHLLFYQATRSTIYFDFLFGPDLSSFHRSELSFFSEAAAGPTRKHVARKISAFLSLVS